MPGFPTHILGTPTIRGKAQRYKGSCKERCWASRHIVGTPGKNNRDAEGAPHNSGKSQALQGQLQRKMPG